jgi:hypothetical protein
MSAQRNSSYGDRFVLMGNSTTPYPDLAGYAYLYADAAVKLWPTTPLEVLPAAGAGYLWSVLACTVLVDTSGAGYAGVHSTAAAISLSCGGSDVVKNDPAILGVQQVDSLLEGASHMMVTFTGRAPSEVAGSGALSSIQTIASGVRPVVVSSFTAYANTPVTLVFANGTVGSLTAGNSLNEVRTHTIALRVPAPSLW